jgi:hypothetical protein
MHSKYSKQAHIQSTERDLRKIEPHALSKHGKLAGVARSWSTIQALADEVSDDTSSRS